MAKRTKSPIKIPSARAEDQPATRKMLGLVRDELKSEIRTLVLKFESRFNENDGKFSWIDGRFNQIDARFNEMEGKFRQIDARFNQVDARFSQLDSRLSRMELLLEEQNSNNRIVLEGLQALWQRQDRVEGRLDKAGI